MAVEARREWIVNPTEDAHWILKRNNSVISIELRAGSFNYLSGPQYMGSVHFDGIEHAHAINHIINTYFVTGFPIEYMDDVGYMQGGIARIIKDNDETSRDKRITMLNLVRNREASWLSMDGIGTSPLVPTHCTDDQVFETLKRWYDFAEKLIANADRNALTSSERLLATAEVYHSLTTLISYEERLKIFEYWVKAHENPFYDMQFSADGKLPLIEELQYITTEPSDFTPLQDSGRTTDSVTKILLNLERKLQDAIEAEEYLSCAYYRDIIKAFKHEHNLL